MTHLFCFGLGYSARVLAQRLSSRGWTVSATSRSADGASRIADEGYRGFVFDGTAALPPTALDGVTHVLISAPPADDGDPVVKQLRAEFVSRAVQFRWIAYLSTTGVYGDHAGGWVSEDTPPTPNTARGVKRCAAEAQWLDLWRNQGLPVHIFRLAGIYGPGRNQLLSVADGTARRIVKPGQVFSRIQVDDIATVLEASIARPDPGRVYNVCDDEACPPQDVIAFAATLLGRPMPPELPYDEACPPQDVIAFAATLLGRPMPPEAPYDEAALSPMARSFYADSKRVANARIKTELGVSLRYPTYREGLAALARDLKP